MSLTYETRYNCNRAFEFNVQQAGLVALSLLDSPKRSCDERYTLVSTAPSRAVLGSQPRVSLNLQT